jgi:hypothetical protein
MAISIATAGTAARLSPAAMRRSMADLAPARIDRPRPVR